MKVHNPNKLPTAPISDLLPSQGDLKDLTEKNYKKLKNTIERRGFSVPVYVWEDKQGVKHLLDGHQRQRVLTTEGWNEPIPYLLVPADNIQEAMARLLEITSQYGTITQEGIDEFIAKYELPEQEVYEATSFDAIKEYTVDEEKIEDSPYTDKIEAPLYDVKGDKPLLTDLFDTKKTDELVKDINNSKLDEDIKKFLINAAQRHTVFNYEKVAEYYANSDKETQELMENSALVIIDYEQALEKGFVKMTEKLAGTIENDKK